MGIEIWKFLGFFTCDILGRRFIFSTRDWDTFDDPWLQLNVRIFSVPIGYSAEGCDLKRLDFWGAVESAKSSRLAGLKWPLGRFDWKRIFGDIKRKSCMNTGIRGQQMVCFYSVHLISYRYWCRNFSQVQKLRIYGIRYRYNSFNISIYTHLKHHKNLVPQYVILPEYGGILRNVRYPVCIFIKIDIRFGTNISIMNPIKNSVLRFCSFFTKYR